MMPNAPATTIQPCFVESRMARAISASDMTANSISSSRSPAIRFAAVQINHCH